MVEELGIMAIDPDFYSSLQNFIYFIWMSFGVMVISAIYCIYLVIKNNKKYLEGIKDEK